MSTPIIHKGVEWRRRLTVTNDDTGEATADLSTLTVELRRRATDANLQSYTVGSGLTLGAAGVADLAIPAVDSAPLETAGHVLRVLLEDQVVLDWIRVSVRD